MLRDRIDRWAYPDRAKLAIARQLRRNPTPAERHAWSLLRNRGILGLKFRRQQLVQGFIVDLYCPKLSLVLELDGVAHESPAQAGYDAARTAWLEAHGYCVRRLPNRDASREGLERLLRPFLPARRGAMPSAHPPSPDRERGTGGEVRERGTGGEVPETGEK